MTLEERALEYRSHFGNDEDAIMLAMTGFAEMIAAEERERIASYLDGYAGGHYMAQSCASAIRNMEQGQ